jgi:hypothetical protein
VSRLRLVAAAVVGGLVLLGASTATAAGPYPPPSKGSGHVEPSRIRVGECAVFSGDGFAPATPVSVTDNGEPRGTTTSRADGTFSIRLCYSSNARRGRHDLVGTGAGAGGGTLSVSAVLIVEGVRQTPTTVGNNGGAVSGEGVGGGNGTGGGTGVLPFTGSPELLVVAAAGLVAVFLASLVLLLVPRRRRRRRQGDGAPLPA